MTPEKEERLHLASNFYKDCVGFESQVLAKVGPVPQDMKSSNFIQTYQLGSSLTNQGSLT